MKFIVLLVFLLVFVPGWAAVRYDDPQYSIELEEDWVKAHTPFVEHVAFTSTKHAASLKIMAVAGPTRPGRTRYSSLMILEEVFGKERSQDSAVVRGPSSTWEFGDGFASSFVGRDSHGRSFKYVVIVKLKKLAILVFETSSDRETALNEISDSAIKGLRFGES